MTLQSADCQLIEEMLDEGHPMTMETNMLKEIVLPPTLMRKLMNVAGVSGCVSSDATFLTPDYNHSTRPLHSLHQYLGGHPACDTPITKSSLTSTKR